MGIRGLFKLLRRWEKQTTIEAACGGTSVGIDLFWFLYQGRGDTAQLHTLLAPFFEFARAVHVVVDGSVMTEERRETVVERGGERQKTLKIMEEIMDAPLDELGERDRQTIAEYVEKLKRQAWRPTREYIEDVVRELEEKGAVAHWAEGEADDELVRLEKEGVIDVVVTNDSDVIALGAENMIRVTSQIVVQLSKSHMMEQMGFTITQWEMFIGLLRKETEPLVAYSMARVYGKR